MYQAPRRALEAVKNLSLKELGRSERQGFCCGAGGGRNVDGREDRHADQPEPRRGDRPERREHRGTACPFCLTMLRDGVSEKNLEGKLDIKDVAELVAEGLAEAVPERSRRFRKNS